MNYRVLGRTGLTVSEIGQGTMAFNARTYGRVEAREARATIHKALDLGINFYDTAPLYGTLGNDGEAEAILGEALGKRRDEVIVSTKFGRHAGRPFPPDFSAAGARRFVEESLMRLGTDRVDVLFFHSPFSEGEIPDDVWGELDRIREEGKARFIGHSISNFAETEGMARRWAEERKIDVVQTVCSLMNRESASLIRDLAAQGVGMVARECLANGYLSGAVREDTVFPEGSANARHDRAEIVRRVRYAAQLSGLLVREPVRSLAQAALRWILDNQNVSLALTGAKRIEELVDCAAASALPPFGEDVHGEVERVHVRDYSPM